MRKFRVRDKTWTLEAQSGRSHAKWETESVVIKAAAKNFHLFQNIYIIAALVQQSTESGPNPSSFYVFHRPTQLTHFHCQIFDFELARARQRCLDPLAGEPFIGNGIKVLHIDGNKQRTKKTERKKEKKKIKMDELQTIFTLIDQYSFFLPV